MKLLVLILLLKLFYSNGINLEYLDPIKLQTVSSPKVQEQAALKAISRYTGQVNVEVNPILFKNHKDVFTLRTSGGQLFIRASTGVAAVWGFNYYLKKYCKSHIAWQVQRVKIPSPLPEVDEVVIANDRFRYYQNVCTASYSFAWWDVNDWIKHVEWMALNGINLALAPVAQEAAWAKVYSQIGMTEEEIDAHFTGPAFLAWLRMGNVRGWAGPLPASWNHRQKIIQETIVDYMVQLGIVPVYPAFNGHVPRAFARIYPNTTFYNVANWNNFDTDYCCGLFLNPTDPLFRTIGMMFNNEVTVGSPPTHIYAVDPFNEVKITPWSQDLIRNTSLAIFALLSEVDDKAVWLVQNWMFVHDPVLWSLKSVQLFLTSVPNGRMLVLDLQSEQWPQYNLYQMYYGQPFIWCMLHNFGGTLGMFGNMQSINNDVYEARNKENSTMIGMGLTPEGINQNYVVYELMLESAWRPGPVELEPWVEEYAERRYGCNATASAWKYLLKSVYNFDSLYKMRGKYVITRRPSFSIRPWAWYKSKDLFNAFRKFAFINDFKCFDGGFIHDLVDVTRQALQYRAEQLYLNIVESKLSTTWVFNASVNRFLDVMSDIELILFTNEDFMSKKWLSKARELGVNDEERYFYELNARNQITLWGPNGEISDYACKQWAELFHYYYIPRWTTFLYAALDAKVRKEVFDEKRTLSIVRATVEEKFANVVITPNPGGDPRQTALALCKKWAFVSGLDDLPLQFTNSKLQVNASVEDDDYD